MSRSSLIQWPPTASPPVVVRWLGSPLFFVAAVAPLFLRASKVIGRGVSYTLACTTNVSQFRVVAAYLAGDFAMAEILEGSRVITQITTVKFTPDKQDEVLNLMIERARFMATQPGFVSIALHRSKDASHVVNYVQWRDAFQRLKATAMPGSFPGSNLESAASNTDVLTRHSRRSPELRDSADRY